MFLTYDRFGLLLPNDSKFLVTVSNYSFSVDYQLDDSVDAVTPLLPRTSVAAASESLSVYTVIIAVIAALTVLSITGHVIFTCRKRNRRQTWSVQSTNRNRFFSRDIWTGTAAQRPDSSQQSPNTSPTFQTDMYRTLAYAYVNWKQDVTSTGSSRSFSSTSGSSDKREGVVNNHVIDSLTSFSSPIDDVTLSSSALAGDVSTLSSIPENPQRAVSVCRKSGETGRHHNADDILQDPSPISNCSTTGQ